MISLRRRSSLISISTHQRRSKPMPDCNASLAAAAGPPLDISPVAVAAPAAEEAWLGVGVGSGDRGRVKAGFSLTDTPAQPDHPRDGWTLDAR